MKVLPHPSLFPLNPSLPMHQPINSQRSQLTGHRRPPRQARFHIPLPFTASSAPSVGLKGVFPRTSSPQPNSHLPVKGAVAFCEGFLSASTRLSSHLAAACEGCEGCEGCMQRAQNQQRRCEGCEACEGWFWLTNNRRFPFSPPLGREMFVSRLLSPLVKCEGCEGCEGCFGAPEDRYALSLPFQRQATCLTTALLPPIDSYVGRIAHAGVIFFSFSHGYPARLRASMQGLHSCFAKTRFFSLFGLPFSLALTHADDEVAHLSTYQQPETLLGLHPSPTALAAL